MTKDYHLLFKREALPFTDTFSSKAENIETGQVLQDWKVFKMDRIRLCRDSHQIIYLEISDRQIS